MNYYVCINNIATAHFSFSSPPLYESFLNTGMPLLSSRQYREDSYKQPDEWTGYIWDEQPGIWRIRILEVVMAGKYWKFPNIGGR